MENYVTLIGIIITAAITLYTLRRRLWSKIISQSRNERINDFRDEVATIVSTLRIIECVSNVNQTTNRTDNMDIKEDWLIKRIYEAEKARARLLTKLNTSKIAGNVNNFALNDLLIKIDFNINANVNPDTIYEEV